jgi:hypothetical protein
MKLSRHNQLGFEGPRCRVGPLHQLRRFYSQPPQKAQRDFDANELKFCAASFGPDAQIQSRARSGRNTRPDRSRVGGLNKLLLLVFDHVNREDHKSLARVVGNGGDCVRDPRNVGPTDEREAHGITLRPQEGHRNQRKNCEGCDDPPSEPADAFLQSCNFRRGNAQESTIKLIS